MVAVGQRGGLGASRVHHHQPAAALPQLLEAPLEARRGHHAAVRDDRVGAEDQQVVGAIDVGHRQQQLVAEHQGRRNVVRQLIDRGRRVAVAVRRLRIRAGPKSIEPQLWTLGLPR